MVEVRAKDVRLVPLKDIKLNPKNRNKHSPEQIAQFVKILRYQGNRNPGVISNRSGLLVAGEGRYLAMKEAGETHMPVMFQDFEDEEQEYLYGISDNAIASQAALDLAEIHVDLKDMGPFDLDLLGIKDFQFEPDPESMGDPDAVPEVPKVAKTKRGELWTLGKHRLLIDDCTIAENVTRLMGGEKAHIWQSDPPYGINHVEVANEKGQAKGYAKIANDELQDEALKEFIFKSITAALPHMEKGFAFYMWHAMKMQSYFAAAAAAAGILFHRQIIWVKPQFVFGRGQYHWRHELCLMGWLEGDECPFYGERNQSTIWEIGRENDKIHPTQKPIAIWEAPLTNHTHTGQIAYEPFAGSGSQIIACETMRRRCFSMELEPLYGDVILTRFAKFSGKDPVREDGMRWSELNAV